MRIQWIRIQCALNPGPVWTGLKPEFSSAVAAQYFSEGYQSEPHQYSQPPWMPAAKSPSVQFVCGEISLNEVKKAIKKAKNLSAPSPFDAIPYSICKQCPSLAVALHSLFNTCWTTSAVPKHWKTAVIRLLAKGPAEEFPSEPSNFRPIALTPSTGKLFSTILRNRWLDFMLSNGYLNRSIQKAFLPVTPGCTEHHLKLAPVLAEARRKHKSLSVC